MDITIKCPIHGYYSKKIETLSETENNCDLCKAEKEGKNTANLIRWKALDKIFK